MMATDEASLPDSFQDFADIGETWTDHALRRWDERMPVDAVAPETACDRGVYLPDDATALFGSNEHKEPDRVKVYADDAASGRYAALMLIQEFDVVTTYRAADCYDRPTRAYVWAALAVRGDRRGV